MQIFFKEKNSKQNGSNGAYSTIGWENTASSLYINLLKITNGRVEQRFISYLRLLPRYISCLRLLLCATCGVIRVPELSFTASSKKPLVHLLLFIE